MKKIQKRVVKNILITKRIMSTLNTSIMNRTMSMWNMSITRPMQSITSTLLPR